MAIRDGKVAEKIRNVILAAPDVDVNVASEQITAMGAQRPQFTLFVSEDDQALSPKIRRLSNSSAEASQAARL